MDGSEGAGRGSWRQERSAGVAASPQGLPDPRIQYPEHELLHSFANSSVNTMAVATTLSRKTETRTGRETRRLYHAFQRNVEASSWLRARLFADIKVENADVFNRKYDETVVKCFILGV
jgi:hypothetical protein